MGNGRRLKRTNSKLLSTSSILLTRLNSTVRHPMEMGTMDQVSRLETKVQGSLNSKAKTRSTSYSLIQLKVTSSTTKGVGM